MDPGRRNTQKIDDLKERREYDPLTDQAVKEGKIESEIF